MATHYFYKEDSIVCIGGVSDFVDGFHGCIDCSIVTNGGICSPKIIVDCARTTHARNTKFLFKNHGSGISSVSAYANDAFNAQIY